jgi:hypothetical protein
MLTVWDWKNERIILRTKAFSQEVYNVRFSQFDEGKLTTSGMGHIRFWKMAKTFTGLKLQGDIGKFGKFDLSDVSAFGECEDGKILSGSEVGQLLLWEGNFIKIEVGRPNGGLAHDGEIFFVSINVKSGQVITAGDDGAVRFWAYEPIDVAEASDEQPRLELEPLKEVNMPEGVKIKAVLRGDDHWVSAFISLLSPLFKKSLNLHPHFKRFLRNFYFSCSFYFATGSSRWRWLLVACG